MGADLVKSFLIGPRLLGLNMETKSLYFKLQTIRTNIAEMKLPKSGYNEYKNFKYYELSDFLPQILRQCLESKIMTLFQLKENQATLEVSDFETGEIVIFSAPFERPQIQGAQAIQNLGGAITYMRRYLYSMAFEIVDNDEFDATIGQKGAGNKPSLPPPAPFKLSDAQLKRMFTIANANGYSNEKVKELMIQRYKVDSSRLLSKQQYEEFCLFFEKNSLKMKLEDAFNMINGAGDAINLAQIQIKLKAKAWTYEEGEQIDLAIHDKSESFKEPEPYEGYAPDDEPMPEYEGWKR
jgi:hypothetical protein